LSTPGTEHVRRGRQDSGVASTDDIHTPVENNTNHPHDQHESDNSARKPPGQFISDELEEQTARFIEEAKGLARRRTQTEREDRPGPPPKRPAGPQRSRRR